MKYEGYPPPSHEVEAREFDGTFDVKPQVYGTYANNKDYPPRYSDVQRGGDYPPGVDYRDHPDHPRYQPPPSRMEREGYRPPPPGRDYYARDGYREQEYRRDYPAPPRDAPASERDYDYGHPKHPSPPRDAPMSERDYDYGPPKPQPPMPYDQREYERGHPPPSAPHSSIPRSERIYDLPPHERDYAHPPPPQQYRSHSPPPHVASGYERPARDREGTTTLRACTYIYEVLHCTQFKWKRHMFTCTCVQYLCMYMYTVHATVILVIVNYRVCPILRYPSCWSRDPPRY